MEVLSLDKMVNLRNFGIDVRPKYLDLFYHFEFGVVSYLKFGKSVDEDDIKAFTMQDIIQILPKSILIGPKIYYLSTGYIISTNKYTVSFRQPAIDILIEFENSNVLIALYDIFIWLLEREFIKI